MNFYKRYIGDYQRKTGHLSICEHGAYTLMLDVHYATGKPLPPEEDRLFRLLRATTDQEQLAVAVVLDHFWKLTDQGWVNPRAMEEIGKAKAQAKTNQRIATERETKRLTKRSTNDQPIHSHSHSQNQIPDTKPRKKKKISPAPSPEDAVLMLLTSSYEIEYPVTKEKRAEYQKTYPGIDVDQELRSVQQWCIDNPSRRKTARGMPRFLNAWMDRAQNRPRPKQDKKKPLAVRLAEIEAKGGQP